MCIVSSKRSRLAPNATPNQLEAEVSTLLPFFRVYSTEISAMSKVIKQISPQELQAWDLSPDSKISYYDGKLLIVSDADEEAPFGIAAKAGISALFGIAVFTHAPLVGMVCAAYAAYKVTETVRGLYGGDNALTSRLEQDLGIVAVEEVATPTIAPQSESLPAATDSGPVATSSPIGNHTRLRAVEVPSSPDAQSDWKTPEIQSPVTPIVLSKLREVCDRNNSFYVAGSKGSGKGIFASNLLRWKLDQYPNAIALVLDPKGDLKEAGYWRHDRIRHFAFKGIALSSEQYQEKIVEFLAEARNLVSQADVTRGMRLFLVLDELLTIKESISNALFAEFRRFGVSAISTGDSEGIHLIAITQSFNAGDSFGSDELLKNFTQVGLFRQDEYTRAKKLIQFGRSNGELTESEFKALISQSSVGRVMAIAGEFIPTPKAENHSAFDRDSGKTIQQMPLGSNPTEGDILANELNRKIQTMNVSSPAEGDETDRDELAIRAEVKRFLLANADGSKPRDLSARGRKPVKGMATDDIKFVLDLMALEGEIHEVDGTYFANRK